MTSIRISQIYTFDHLAVNARGEYVFMLAKSWYLPEGESIEVIQSLN